MSNLEHKQQQFLNLYNPVQKKLSGYCRALTGNGVDAHDLMQEAVLQAFENFEKLRSHDSFLFFISAIARNICLKSRRRLKFWIDIEKTDADSMPSNNTSADDGLEVQMLYRTIAKLPFNQREALVMFEIMGFSLEEIRQQQGGTLSGVKSRVTRARQSLTKMLNRMPKPVDFVLKPDMP